MAESSWKMGCRGADLREGEPRLVKPGDDEGGGPARQDPTIHGRETLAIDKALLATGAAPRKPAIHGADGESCFSLRSFADARSIAEAAGGAARAARGVCPRMGRARRPG